VTVSIRKFRITVLVSNRIEYWSNYSIRFEISNIRTALLVICLTFTHLVFWLSKKLPVGKSLSKSIKATVMKMKYFVLTFTTSYHQLTICARIVAIKDSQWAHLTWININFRCTAENIFACQQRMGHLFRKQKWTYLPSNLQVTQHDTWNF